MEKNKRIYLTGFMTSGKSTIGPIVANVLGWKFFDLDKVIEESENETIVNIFKIKGEPYFRNLETETLARLSGDENIVIALGGGTLANEKNLDLIRNKGTIVYLKVSPEVLYKRLKNKIDRPLFRDLVLKEKNKEEFVSRIKNLLDKREEFYNKADLVINTDETKIGITVDNLAHKIKKLIYGKS